MPTPENPIPTPVSPPALGETQQAALRAAAPELPAKWGIELANWNWKVVRQFVLERFGINLSRSSCLNYLHRLGFVLKCPKKRLVKADEAKREAFVAEPPGGTRRYGPEPGYSLPTRPTSGRTRNCGASGCSRESRPPASTRAGFGGIDQPALWRKGQLLLGGMSGDGRGGMDGTGGQQQLRNLGRLPEAT